MAKFDSTIKEWENMRNFPNKDYKEFFDAEKEFFKKNIAQDSKILDIGCGAGEDLIFLSKISNDLYGIDNNPEAIKLCKNLIKKHHIDSVKISLEDAEKTQFKDNYFDIILCMGNTFGNFGEEREKILEEIKRILKNSGSLIISCYNENALESRMELYDKVLANNYKLIDKDKGTIILKDNVITQQFTKEEITKIMQDAGFIIEEIEKGSIYYLIKVGKP